jgi:hypothetical protein
MYTILQQIFKAQRQGFQVWFAYTGFAIGLLILLSALQLYGQLNSLLGNSQKMGGYILISKQVNIGNTMFFSRPTFSIAEVENLQNQKTVIEVAPVIANQFEVMAYVEQVGFYSELFFESVDKRFIDEQPDSFEWKEGDPQIPIILAKDMLDLYNFGFALGKGGSMPQISTTTAKLVSIGIRVKGERGEQKFTGRVVGFSERISTILVPMSFMKWANKNIGAGKATRPSRLLLKVRNTSSPELTSYLSDNGYQVNEDRLRAGKIGNIVQNLMSGIGIIGALFMILSGALFLMNFRAILAEAKEEITLLLQLGYTPKMITDYLMRHFILMLSILFSIVCITLYVGEYFFTPFLITKGLELPQGIFIHVWLAGLSFVLFAFLMNYWNVRHKIG